MVWWVLQTGSKGEAFAFQRLGEWTRRGNFGDEANVLPYFPHTLETEVIAYRGVDTGRKRQVKRALFPRYMFLSVNVDRITGSDVDHVPEVGRLIRRYGKPVVVPDRIMLALLGRAETSDKFGEVDKTKRSFWFKGAVGDVFTFVKPSPFTGLQGWITSTNDLDIGGTVLAYVLMFNKMHEVSVPVSQVGSIVQDLGKVALKAAA